MNIDNSVSSGNEPPSEAPAPTPPPPSQPATTVDPASSPFVLPSGAPIERDNKPSERRER